MTAMKMLVESEQMHRSLEQHPPGKTFNWMLPSSCLPT